MENTNHLPKGEETPPYFDVTYRSPAGIVGTHFAVLAETPEDAAELTPVMLSYGTPWAPSEFQVLSVSPTPENNRPI